MDVEDFLGYAMVISLVVIPALGLTARFALKPIVDALIRLKEGGLLPSTIRSAEDVPMLVAEVRRLREEVAQLQQTVARLEDAESFHRTLAAPGAAKQLPER
jgi:hypothetical protein